MIIFNLSNLRRHMRGLKAKLMHDPATFDPIRSSVPIEHQSLPHPYYFPCHWVHNRTIFPCCFPVTRCRRPIGSVPRRILAVPEAEEVPLIGVQLCHIFNQYNIMHEKTLQKVNSFHKVMPL